MNLNQFLRELLINRSLHAIILEGNPGFNKTISDLSLDVTTKNESRLHNMPPLVALHLKRWIDLQTEVDTNVWVVVENHEDGVADDFSDLDANTDTAIDGELEGLAVTDENARRASYRYADVIPGGHQPKNSSVISLDLGDEDEDVLNSIINDHVVDSLAEAIPGSATQAMPFPSKESTLQLINDARPPSRQSMRPRPLPTQGSKALVGDFRVSSADGHDYYEVIAEKFRSSEIYKHFVEPSPRHVSPQSTPTTRSFTFETQRRSVSVPKSTSQFRVVIPRDSTTLTKTERRSFLFILISYHWTEIRLQHRKLLENVTTAKKSEYHPRRITDKIAKTATKKVRRPTPRRKRSSSAPPRPSSSAARASATHDVNSSSTRRLTRIARTRQSSKDDEYLTRITDAVVKATSNLADVSMKLQEVAASLSESFSMQSQILSASKLGSSTSNYFSSPPVHSSVIKPIASAHQLNTTPTKASSLYQYQHQEGDISALRDSFTSFPEQKVESHVLNGSMNSSVEDDDLTSLIKQIMRQKLTHLLESPGGSANGKTA